MNSVTSCYVDEIVNNYSKVVHDSDFRDYVVTNALIYVFVCLRSIRRYNDSDSESFSLPSSSRDMWLVHVWNNLNLWHDIVSDVVLYMSLEEINFVLDEKVDNIESTDSSTDYISIKFKSDFTVMDLIKMIKNHMEKIEESIPNVANIVLVNNIMDS